MSPLSRNRKRVVGRCCIKIVSECGVMAICPPFRQACKSREECYARNCFFHRRDSCDVCNNFCLALQSRTTEEIVARPASRRAVTWQWEHAGRLRHVAWMGNANYDKAMEKAICGCDPGIFPQCGPSYATVMLNMTGDVDDFLIPFTPHQCFYPYNPIVALMLPGGHLWHASCYRFK